MSDPQLLRTIYASNLTALVYAGEVAVLELQLQAPSSPSGPYQDEDLSGRSFVQQVFNANQVVKAQAAGEVVTENGATFLRFTLTGDVTKGLLPAGAKSADLKHVVYELLEDGRVRVFDPVTFAVRTAGDPSVTPPVVAAPGDGSPVRFVFQASATTRSVALRAIGGRGRSAKQVAIDAGVVDPEITDEDFADWLLSGPVDLLRDGVDQARDTLRKLSEAITAGDEAAALALEEEAEARLMGDQAVIDGLRGAAPVDRNTLEKIADFIDQARSHFASKAAAAAAAIPVALASIVVGGSAYARVEAQPAHELRLRSADGQWWELDENVVRRKDVDAAADGVTNDAPALSKLKAYCDAKGATFDGEGRTYKVNSGVFMPLRFCRMRVDARDVTTSTSYATGGTAKAALLITGDDIWHASWPKQTPLTPSSPLAAPAAAAASSIQLAAPFAFQTGDTVTLQEGATSESVTIADMLKTTVIATAAAGTSAISCQTDSTFNAKPQVGDAVILTMPDGTYWETTLAAPVGTATLNLANPLPAGGAPAGTMVWFKRVTLAAGLVNSYTTAAALNRTNAAAYRRDDHAVWVPDVTAFSRFDPVILHEGTSWSAWGSTLGQRSEVKNVLLTIRPGAGTAGYLVFMSPLYGKYAIAGMTVRKYATQEAEISDVYVKGAGLAAAQAGIIAIHLRHLKADRIVAEDTADRGFGFYNLFSAQLSGVRGIRCNAPGTGYVLASGGSSNITVTDITGIHSRHVWTAGAGISAFKQLARRVTIGLVTGQGCLDGGFDCHPGVVDVVVGQINDEGDPNGFGSGDGNIFQGSHLSVSLVNTRSFRWAGFRIQHGGDGDDNPSTYYIGSTRVSGDSSSRLVIDVEDAATSAAPGQWPISSIHLPDVNGKARLGVRIQTQYQKVGSIQVGGNIVATEGEAIYLRTGNVAGTGWDTCTVLPGSRVEALSTVTGYPVRVIGTATNRVRVDIGTGLLKGGQRNLRGAQADIYYMAQLQGGLGTTYADATATYRTLNWV